MRLFIGSCSPLGRRPDHEVIGGQAGKRLERSTLAIIIHIEGSAAIVRWRDDGVAPTAAVGMPFAAKCLTVPL